MVTPRRGPTQWARPLFSGELRRVVPGAGRTRRKSAPGRSVRAEPRPEAGEPTPSLLPMQVARVGRSLRTAAPPAQP
jgi:hypothetical protein